MKSSMTLKGEVTLRSNPGWKKRGAESAPAKRCSIKWRLLTLVSILGGSRDSVPLGIRRWGGAKRDLIGQKNRRRHTLKRSGKRRFFRRRQPSFSPRSFSIGTVSRCMTHDGKKKVAHNSHRRNFI